MPVRAWNLHQACLEVAQPAASQSNLNERSFVERTRRIGLVYWGIYHQEREFAGEVGDPCLGVVTAENKAEAEASARRLGISGPTGIWAHPLPEATNQRT